MSQPPLRIARTFDAPAEAVFDAFASAEVLARWLHPGADWTADVELDFRVGGSVRVVMRETDGTEHGGGGRYTEIERPRRIAYEWTWDRDGVETLVEFDLVEADGATTVTLTHSGLPSEEELRGHRTGWDETLDNLGTVLGERRDAEGSR